MESIRVGCLRGGALVAISVALAHLFWERVLPVLLLIALGYLFQRRMQVDTVTLNRINLYLFVPALALSRLLETPFSASLLGAIALAVSLNMLALYALSRLFSIPLRWQRTTVTTVSLGAMFGNAGNYGLPLVELVLGRQAVSYQALVFVLNNLLFFTLGVALMAGSRQSLKATVRQVFSLPPVYAVTAGLLLPMLGISLPIPVVTALRYLGDGLIPVALISLGAQLAERVEVRDATALTVAVVLRLVAAPLLMVGIVKLLGLSGVLAQTLILGAAAPTAVNTVVLAIELQVNPSLASAIVLVTTLLSAVTVTVTAFLLIA
jgi:predicted permease